MWKEWVRWKERERWEEGTECEKILVNKKKEDSIGKCVVAVDERLQKDWVLPNVDLKG
jgi:hypothetical protein